MAITEGSKVLSSNCHMKIYDFGLCRSIAESSGPPPVLTNYVAIRWYREPGK
jgi:mitogen-activated protein kinase 15